MPADPLIVEQIRGFTEPFRASIAGPVVVPQYGERLEGGGCLLGLSPLRCAQVVFTARPPAYHRT